jgi:hypothetical protein
MASQSRRWRVDVYYSGYTTVTVRSATQEEALTKGREKAARLLQKATVMDPVGAAAQLARLLEPWEACDTAEPIGKERKTLP